MVACSWRWRLLFPVRRLDIIGVVDASLAALRDLTMGRAAAPFSVQGAARTRFRGSPAHSPSARWKSRQRPFLADCARGLAGGWIEYSAKTSMISMRFGGRGEIRTHEGLAPLAVFKTAALNHSATLPVRDSMGDAGGLCKRPTALRRSAAGSQRRRKRAFTTLTGKAFARAGSRAMVNATIAEGLRLAQPALPSRGTASIGRRGAAGCGRDGSGDQCF